jgi:hypothetical protein
MPLTVAEENEVERARVLQRMREKAAVFREVFGAPGQLTPHGKVIMDALHATFGRGIPKNVLDAHDRCDPLQTWRALGHRDVLESIYDAIAWKESEHVNPSSSRPK